MEYSPTLLASLPHRISTTPPLLTKRDKRRNAIEQRMKDIEVTFAMGRQAQSRTQINQISRDINFINRADPYDSKPLEDYADEIGSELGFYGKDNVVVGLRGTTVGLSDTEARPALGKWASKFVQDVNDEMEKRDTELTEVAVCTFEATARPTSSTPCTTCRFATSLVADRHCPRTIFKRRYSR